MAPQTLALDRLLQVKRSLEPASSCILVPTANFSNRPFGALAVVKQCCQSRALDVRAGKGFSRLPRDALWASLGYKGEIASQLQQETTMHAMMKGAAMSAVIASAAAFTPPVALPALRGSKTAVCAAKFPQQVLMVLMLLCLLLG